MSKFFSFSLCVHFHVTVLCGASLLRDFHGGNDRCSWMFSTDSSFTSEDQPEHFSFTFPLTQKCFIKLNIVNLSGTGAG
jgi:hypothetical protein